MNSQDRLVHMANQIARNFETMGPEKAALATADHIATYWDPRMKAGIFAYGEGLTPIAAHAIAVLRDGAPAHQTRATEFNAVDEAGGSDAG
jgi:formate dehydrogenase subunit delta